MKQKRIFFSSCLALFALAGCPSPSPSFEISKVWIVKTVKENGQLVYTRGAFANLKNGYEQFRLDVSQPSKVLYKDVDDVLVTGTWQLSSDGQSLKMSNLAPVPTGTNGEINFTVGQNPTNELLKLTRTATSVKTGGTINEYELIPAL